MAAAPPSARLGRLLWVEGRDDSAVIQSLCASHHVPQVFRVQEKGGISPLMTGLGVEIRAPALRRFGIVVDANGDAAERWAGIRTALEGQGYRNVPSPLPAEGVVVAPPEGLPRFGAWIMPDNRSPGALEDFAGALVPERDALWSRAGASVDAIPDEDRRFPAVRRSKAHMHTWLAWQEYPGSPMGQAIGKGDLDAHAPAALRFISWLRRLMTDEPPEQAAPAG